MITTCTKTAIMAIRFQNLTTFSIYTLEIGNPFSVSTTYSRC